MIPTMIAKTRTPGSPATNEDKSAGRSDPEDRLHVSALVAGLIDARACHIDFLDTPGGQESERWYRRHRAARRHHGLTPGR
jgi:hypothetical protein